jgi:hypothetical protein
LSPFYRLFETKSLPHERSECFGHSYSYLTKMSVKMGQNDFSAVDLLFSDRLLEYRDAERSARTALTLGRLPEEDGIQSTDNYSTKYQ